MVWFKGDILLCIAGIWSTYYCVLRQWDIEPFEKDTKREYNVYAEKFSVHSLSKIGIAVSKHQNTE